MGTENTSATPKYPHGTAANKAKKFLVNLLLGLTCRIKMSCDGKILDKSLEDLLGSELDPLINGEVAVAPGVVLLEESLVLSLNSKLSFIRGVTYCNFTSAGVVRPSFFGVLTSSDIIGVNWEMLTRPHLVVSWSVNNSSMNQYSSTFSGPVTLVRAALMKVLYSSTVPWSMMG